MYRKILLINPFGIGDVLFTTPIIHSLKDEFPGIKLGYLCNSRTAEILKNSPFIDYVFIYDRDEFEQIRKNSHLSWVKKGIAFLNLIKKRHFDLVLDFSLNQQYSFFSWYAGIKKRIGFDFKKRGRLLTQKVLLDGYHDKHIVEYYGQLLHLLGIHLKYQNLELYLRKEDLQKAELMLAKHGIKQSDLLIGIVPAAGRSWGKDAHLKHWSAKNFATLADKIIENYQAKIIILGDFSEENIAKEVLDNMSHTAVNFAGKTTVGELAAILSKTGLVITNDGGPLHMAAALGVKTVSIFGPVDEKVYGPYPPSSNHIVVKKDLSCRPCYQNFRLPRCFNNHRCIEDLTVDEAYDAVRRLM